MSAIVHSTALTTEGIARLLEQYKESTQLNTLMRIYLDSVQEAENVTWDMRLKLILANAVGDQLDILGAIVGEPRNDREDALYKIWIGVRIRLNRSFGRPLDVIECLLLATEADFEYREHEDACFSIIFNEMPLYPNDLNYVVYLARAAGIGINFIYPTVDDGTEFRFRGVSDTSNPDNGFCAVADL